MPSKYDIRCMVQLVEKLKPVFQGKLLLRLGADRYLPQIVFFFAMATLAIAVNLGIESTLHRKEENKKAIENLKSVHTELTCRLTSLNSVCKVEDMLQDRGSLVQIPQNKAKRIK